MRVLVSGAGIAGPTLAYWLARHGFEATIVETAPQLRTGGYIVDFWGAGFDIAERMGLVPEIVRRGYPVQEVRMVDDAGERVAGFPTSVFARSTRGRYVSVPRGELASAIHRRLDGVETIFGDGITSLDDDGSRVQVQFERASTRSFDLVVGADGLHSNVRSMVFGAEAHFEHHLGYQVAAFEVAGYRPRDELVYVMYTQVGQQVARFSLRDDRTLVLFIFADDETRRDDPQDLDAQKAILRARFAESGWECAQILAAMDSTRELYFDRVSQIRMDRWTRGRVALVGDAAFCVSLLGGQGSALAMIAAYVLAGELKAAGGDHDAAFRAYESRLGPFLHGKQSSAAGFAGAFAPKSALGLWIRNAVTKLLAIPWVADRVLGRGLADDIELPEY